MASDPAGRAGHAGFRLNALVSLLANESRSKLAAEFVRAKDDSDELQTFVNTILAEGWKAGLDVDELALASRVEPFSLDAIPEEVLVVTVGVDVQDDRLEASVVGWARTAALVLAHVVIWGSPDLDSTWVELDELLKTRWRHPHGGTLRVDACVVDSGDRTDTVYNFCFPRLARGIWAGKGVSGSRPAIQMSQGKIRGGGKLFLIGSETIKAQLADRLSRGRGIRFSHGLEPVYFEQLASERMVIRYVRGQPVRRFEASQSGGPRRSIVWCTRSRRGRGSISTWTRGRMSCCAPSRRPSRPPRFRRRLWRRGERRNATMDLDGSAPGRRLDGLHPEVAAGSNSAACWPPSWARSSCSPSRPWRSMPAATASARSRRRRSMRWRSWTHWNCPRCCCSPRSCSTRLLVAPGLVVDDHRQPPQPRSVIPEGRLHALLHAHCSSDRAPHTRHSR